MLLGAAVVTGIISLASFASVGQVTLTIIPATISAVASVLAALIGSRNFANITRTETKVEHAVAKVEDVHTLVNGAASTAMEALTAQTAALVSMTEKRDELVSEREKAHIDREAGNNNPVDVNIVGLPPDARP